MMALRSRVEAINGPEATLGYDRLEVLDYLRRAAQRIRRLSGSPDGGYSEEMKSLADVIAADAAILRRNRFLTGQ